MDLVLPQHHYSFQQARTWLKTLSSGSNRNLSALPPARIDPSNEEVSAGTNCDELVEIQQQWDSPLFKLPGELRNQIYRNVLSENLGHRKIGSPTAQHPLLRTCRRIQTEAQSIYYLECEFHISADRFDCSLLKAFQDHTRTVLGRQLAGQVVIHIHIYRFSAASWGNLMKWLAAYQAGEVIRLIHIAKGGDDWFPFAASEAFDMVDLMRDMPLNWEQKVQLLECHRRATERGVDLMLFYDGSGWDE